MAILFIVVIMGFLLLMNSRFDINFYTNYYHGCEAEYRYYPDENDSILKTQLFKEMYKELHPDNIYREVTREPSPVILYQNKW